MFQGLPRWLIVFGITVFAVIEIGSRLPDLMLLPQKLAGGAGEYGAKALQPRLTETQIAKTDAEAKVTQLQEEVTAAQAAKTRAETQLAQMQAVATAAQVDKTRAETRVAQLQAAVTVATADKTQADAQLAQSQTTKTNLENAGTMLGYAALAAGGIYVANKMGLIPHSDGTAQASTSTTTQPLGAQPAAETSASFEAGRNDWHHYHDWEASLDANSAAGVKYWAGVRSQKSARPCAAAPGANAAGFQDGCEAAKKFLASVDHERTGNSDYRAGWTQGAKETGNQ